MVVQESFLDHLRMERQSGFNPVSDTWGSRKHCYNRHSFLLLRLQPWQRSRCQIKVKSDPNLLLSSRFSSLELRPEQHESSSFLNTRILRLKKRLHFPELSVWCLFWQWDLLKNFIEKKKKREKLSKMSRCHLLKMFYWGNKQVTSTSTKILIKIWFTVLLCTTRSILIDGK